MSSRRSILTSPLMYANGSIEIFPTLLTKKNKARGQPDFAQNHRGLFPVA